MTQFKKILVLAPHTDDGELGCGSTINKFATEGAEIFYVAFSICTRSLPAGLAPDTLAREVTAATHILGVKKENLILFDYDVRYFPTHRQAILEDMVKIGRDIKPDLVLQPNSNDLHQDHNTVYHEGLRAFKGITTLGYELPWNNLSVTTNTFIRMDEKHIDKKIEALKEYKSQSHRKYLNDSFIRGLAQMRGTQIGSDWAEAFEMIRWVI